MNEKPVILIVDDNSLNRRIMSNFVQRMNVDVLETDSSTKAVEIVSESDIDMIIIDIFMPSLNGYESIHKIRNLKGKKSDVPIVGVSGSFDEKTKQLVLENKLNDLVSKPLQKNDIERLFSQYFKTENSDIFNVKEFEYFYKDAGLRKDILETFIEESKSDILKISVAFKTKDCDNIYKIAHYLKGTFNYLKAKKALETSVEILRLCKEGLIKEVLKYEWELTENYKNLINNVKKYVKDKKM